MRVEPDIANILDEYGCPYPVPVVRMRFWGAINSPAMKISPIEEIDALWRGKRRAFETPEEAQTFYEAMINFWNALAHSRELGNPVALTPRSGLGTGEGLKGAIQSRIAELDDGFLSGFVGSLMRDEPIEPRIDDGISKLFELLDELQDLAEQPLGPKNASRIRSRFVALDKRGQKLINQVVVLTWARGRR